MVRSGKQNYIYLWMFVGVVVLIGSIVSSAGVDASQRILENKPILELTDTTFKQEVELPDVGLALVEFWEPWCGICRQMAPVLDSVNQQLGEQVKIGKVNVSENPQLMFRFEIQYLPTLMVFKNGEKVATKVGYQSKEQLLRWVASFM